MRALSGHRETGQAGQTGARRGGLLRTRGLPTCKGPRTVLRPTYWHYPILEPPIPSPLAPCFRLPGFSANLYNNTRPDTQLSDALPGVPFCLAVYLIYAGSLPAGEPFSEVRRGRCVCVNCGRVCVGARAWCGCGGRCGGAGGYLYGDESRTRVDYGTARHGTARTVWLIA